MTREEAYNLICEINEEAHRATYDEWEAAEDNEELLEEASIDENFTLEEYMEVWG